MSANITSRTLITRVSFSFFFITAVLFIMFMIDGRSVSEFMKFLRFFIPLSAVLLSTFVVTYAGLERKTNFHYSIRLLIAGIISYIVTLGAVDVLYELDLRDVMLGALWVVLLGVISIYWIIANRSKSSG